MLIRLICTASIAMITITVNWIDWIVVEWISGPVNAGWPAQRWRVESTDGFDWWLERQCDSRHQPPHGSEQEAASIETNHGRTRTASTGSSWSVHSRRQVFLQLSSPARRQQPRKSVRYSTRHSERLEDPYRKYYFWFSHPGTFILGDSSRYLIW